MSSNIRCCHYHSLSLKYGCRSQEHFRFFRKVDERHMIYRKTHPTLYVWWLFVFDCFSPLACSYFPSLLHHQDHICPICFFLSTVVWSEPCEHHLRWNWNLICKCVFFWVCVCVCVLLQFGVFCGARANTSGGKEGARRLAVAAESFPHAFTCKFAPLLPLYSHNGAQQIIVSSQRDGFHPWALWMWRGTGLNSYVELSAAATEPDSSSSIMKECKQPGPFSICANVREKDRSQELTAAEMEEAKKPSPEEIDGLVVPAAGSSTERNLS